MSRVDGGTVTGTRGRDRSPRWVLAVAAAGHEARRVIVPAMLAADDVVDRGRMGAAIHTSVAVAEQDALADASPAAGTDGTVPGALAHRVILGPARERVSPRDRSQARPRG